MHNVGLVTWQKKGIVSFLVIAWILLLGITSEYPTKPFAKDSFRVAVVDPQAIIEKSKSGSRALATLKEHAQARENVLKSDQKELEQLQQELQDNNASITEEERKRKKDLFGKKYQEWQKRMQDFQVELGEKQKELVQEYMKKIEAATTIVAKRHGFSLVIDKGSDSTLKIILYNQKGLDITNEVIKEFDRRYK